MASGLLNSEFNRQIRQDLLKRNLYAPNNPYDINNPKIVDTINTIVNVVSPGNSFDITNTILARALNIGPQTPITQIGKSELARQFGRNVAYNAAQEIIPDVNLTNIFDGDPSTKLLTKKKDYQITVKEGQTALGRFLEEISGIQSNSTPFNTDTTNADIISNTGSGQLEFLGTLLSKNQYRPSDASFKVAMQRKNIKLKDVSQLFGDKTYFSELEGDFQNAVDTNYNVKFDEIIYRREIESRENGNEYNTSRESIKDRGITAFPKQKEEITIDELTFSLIDSTKYGYDGDFYFGGDGNVSASDSQLVLGRDEILLQPGNKFGVRTGLLHHTDALMNAIGRDRSSMNRTLGTFTNPKTGEKHFNGNPFAQVSATDQYATYRKAIRYEGNYIYGGNENSTINKRVIPKFHPNYSENTTGAINGNNNMMFSIENLAFLINNDGDTGIKVGEEIIKANGEEVKNPITLKLPLSEVGPHGGRLMWFMPYDIKFDESSISRHDSVLFVGRPEPLYTYNNSERTMNLSFMLLIDYPPQVIGKNHNEIAKFFMLGGEAGNSKQINEDVDKLVKIRDSKKKELEDLNVVKTLNRPDSTKTPTEFISFYWRNDIPKVGTAAELMAELATGYENGINTEVDNNYGGDSGFNADYVANLLGLISDKSLDELKFFNIEIIGTASQLHDSDYNVRLSQRRINAVKAKFKELFESLFNKTPESNGMEFIEDPQGEKNSGILGVDRSKMYTQEVKLDRKTSIRLYPNSKPNVVELPRTPEETVRIAELQKEIDALDTKIRNLKKATSNKISDFKERDINDGINRGFKELETPNRKVIPAFHSYTPEDFHRRLTFLQQCMRAGNSIVNTVNQNGVDLVKNSVFGRPPICVLRIGDFIYSKVIIENMSIQYDDAPWDLNPEGMGMQPMIARIDMSIKIIGGQSLEAPIDVLQSAEDFNYYANSTYFSDDVYSFASQEAQKQVEFNKNHMKAKLDKKFNR